ncbi:hypothetical protein BCR35DRAFT_208464 [Leucosporidium creatinivorum]|uniref:Uncharacterized protein n=1 Tax=Leucosporidium creatinivorum TaxID=106004 RepID=A0A1Y2FY25_9BASI|nr:hypothetical protein BCR35DRAFT_208464 [Leucosporidium creatinivorum]
MSRGNSKNSRPQRPQDLFEDDSDEDWEHHQRGGGGGGGGIPLQPPRDPSLYETEEEWKLHHEAEKTDRLHHLPLILVALPPLGAIIHGRAENWSDALILLLVCWYLYQLVKVPWDLYYASHGRVVLHTAEPSEGYDPALLAQRQHSISVLRRVELVSLASTFVTPAAGSLLLHYVRNLLSDPDRYINGFVIGLFIMATAVKPLLHFSKLVKNYSLFHQEQVWYPNSEVHYLRGRVDKLESELKQLSRAFATKDDVRTLRDGVDIPLTQLSKAVRRFNREGDLLRLSSEDRFNLLETKLERTEAEMLATSAALSSIRYEQEQARSSTLAQLLRVLKYALGHTRSGPFFWLLLPVTAPRAAIEYVATSIEGGEG